MSKAYSDKGQFNEETNKYITEIEQMLTIKYNELLDKGYNIIEVYDIINQANIIQRGKHIWNIL